MNLENIPPELLTPPPRIVKPRKTGYTGMPLLAVRRGEYLTERGLIGNVSDIEWRNISPVMVVGVGLATLVSDLDERYGSDPTWQWKARSPELAIQKHLVQQRTIIDFFGFQLREKGRQNLYHYCLDARAFYVNSQTLPPEDTETLQGLMKWAQQIRDFCKAENLAMRGTASSIAAQYLRDPRFYAEPRRKVPRATNAQVRNVLPGNHYQLQVTTKSKTRYSALVIDQKRAHHYHAEHTTMPNANTLFALGDFKGLKDDSLPADTLTGFHGLYYVRLDVPRGRHPHWSPLRQQRNSGDGYFVFSSEMPMLTDLGYNVRSCIAAWGSAMADEGLQRYAGHCQSQLDKYDNAYWLKPILLATYGLLAVKPRIPAAVFRRAYSDTPYSVLAGGFKRLHGFLVQHTDGNAIEPGIANVLHRGLIEASTRAESLGLAEYLTACGQWVLHVYADAVIIEDNPDKPLPHLPEPWRIKQTLTDWRPINVQSYVSVEDSKLPGYGRDDLRRASLGTVGRAPLMPKWDCDGHQLTPQEQYERGLARPRG